jgi:hypothetical protein
LLNVITESAETPVINVNAKLLKSRIGKSDSNGDKNEK